MSVLIKNINHSDFDSRPPKLFSPPPHKYSVALWRPGYFNERFMIRVIANLFCQASSLQRFPDNEEHRAAYAQHQARQMVVQMCKQPFVIAATYPNRDIAETKLAEIQAQERAYDGRLPTKCIRADKWDF